MFTDATSLHEYFETRQGQPDKVRAVLGPRMRRARMERLRGLNLEAFGRQIAEEMARTRAFSNVTISNWETGRQEPSIEALVAIARLTHLPLRYFVGVGEMDDYPFIDWLVAENGADVTSLETALSKSRSLPEPAQQLVAEQLRTLVNGLYRLRAP